MQAKDFGKWMRERYVQQFGFLPASYQPGMLAARTTNYQRTVGTLSGVLTGLLGCPGHMKEAIPVVCALHVQGSSERGRTALEPAAHGLLHAVPSSFAGDLYRQR